MEIKGDYRHKDESKYRGEHKICKRTHIDKNKEMHRGEDKYVARNKCIQIIKRLDKDKNKKVNE